MRKLVVLALLAVGVQTFALGTPPLPEIDPGSAGSALALLAGALLVVRARRR